MDLDADRKVMLGVYRMHIRWKLDYGCIMYNTARKSYLTRLQTIQKQSRRLGDFPSCTKSVYRKQQSPTLVTETGKITPCSIH